MSMLELQICCLVGVTLFLSDNETALTIWLDQVVLFSGMIPKHYLQLKLSSHFSYTMAQMLRLLVCLVVWLVPQVRFMFHESQLKRCCSPSRPCTPKTAWATPLSSSASTMTALTPYSGWVMHLKGPAVPVLWSQRYFGGDMAGSYGRRAGPPQIF